MMTNASLVAKPGLPLGMCNHFVQPKLEISAPGDRYEQEADAMADRVMRMPSAHTQVKPITGLIGKSVQRKCTHCEEEEKKTVMRKAEGPGYGLQAPPSLVSSINAFNGSGSSLPLATRTFMENAFSTDFSRVRVHTDAKASEMSRDINAKAFTTGSDIYFKSGEYNPDTSKGSHLLAHELTHVVQQKGRSSNAIQRVIELRPPGRGEASAFDRAQELIDRLNRLSTAIEYRLESHSLLYIVVDRDTMTNFDTQLTGFIDQTVMVPLRLVPSTTEVKGDMFWEGYVDLDDLMASDDLGFQSLMLHFLAERFNVNRYAHRIGTDDLSPINLTTLRPNPEFTRAHEVGHQAQVAHFREVFSDPSIEFNYEEGKPSGDAHLVFKSHTGHYRIFVIMHKAVRTATSRVRATSEATVMVMTSDGQWHTVEDFLQMRAAAAAPVVQPKLEINQPGDRYEQEADAMADNVMRMPSAHTQVKPITGLIGKSVQRKCTHCEEEEKKTVMRKAEGPGYGLQAPPSLVSSIGASHGGGSPLSHSTRNFMENAFSTDFSRVRVHTDSNAAKMSKGIHAKAFTHGSDIYFNIGEYAPHTGDGKALLAHELTHVVQQQGTMSATISRQIQTPTKAQIQRDDYLRRLSVWPDEAHNAWRSLNPGEQLVVITYMTARYGVDFASEFSHYTKMKKKPDSIATYTNVLTVTHQQLYGRGFRFVVITLGIEHWVHPSGNSIHRILPSNPSTTKPTTAPTTPENEKKTYEYGGVTYDKQTGKVVSYPKNMEARCMLPCLNETKNDDDCEDCCLDKISANDDGCMNFCISSCQDYYD